VLAAAFAVAACFSVAGKAQAHPHVWATVRSEIIFNDKHQITGVRHSWTFDEFYTAMAVQGLDTNGDGVFSKEELQPLAEVNVKSLKDFDYFTFVHIGYDKSLITLHFTLPLETPLDPHGKVVTVDVYDPSFFVAFGFATESPVKLSGTPAKDCTAKIKRPDAESEEDAKALSEAFFSQLGPNSNFGSQFAQTVEVKCGNAPS
jgi:ABC-type uncharacterized transport system substrate-binding protein